ncbi:hypothetical protein TanjilG_05700 [Lupinus angustifolius]|uniref:Uncharacterized protein n=1 Tax=Lupinus angustifolius TaxID=3871 RepID=A0A4P1QSW2_LUPAN|nr:hypothetical protein TanjilG_05700 [Lupinus angustifolius]
MGIPQTPNPSPSHLYPHEIQLKLYQAFIFSIPILFTIILVLLFYLFYLKRRASSLSSSPFHILPRRSNPQTTYHYSSSNYRLDYLTVQFLDKLPRVLFDDDLRARDSLCSIIPTTTTKFLSPTDSAQQGGVISGSPSHIILLPPQLEDEASASSNNTHILGE